MKPALWHMFISFEMITYHCSVFKDLRRVFSLVLSTGDLIILSSLIHFVKHFFKIFLKKFLTSNHYRYVLATFIIIDSFTYPVNP